ncbi:MAG: Gfo/Idh/MocA family oxidoreductase [Gemmatimonadota bacterium]|nr:Gfo/Idh/MocA family oxidoreductase [Gemmatimonadota bacterium]
MTSLASDRPTEVGLIGYGLGGATFHAPFISATPGLRLAAVMTSDPARRHGVEERYPDTKVVAGIDDLLALSPRLELIAISSPNASHYPLAKAVLGAGRNVVVDKPFAVTSAQARELGEIAKANSVLAMPFQNRRWDGDFLTVRKLMADDRLGRVFRFESRFDRWRGEPKAGWMRDDWVERAENIVHDIATHLVDQALVLFGPVSQVYAELTARRAGVVSFDDAFLALTHASGVSSHLYMSASAGQAGPRLSVFAAKGAYLKFGLDVQEDALRAGMRPVEATYGEEPSEKWGTLVGPEVNEIVPTVAGAYPRFYAGVARAIREGAAPPVAVADVVAGLEIIEAAFVSHARKQVVAL